MQRAAGGRAIGVAVVVALLAVGACSNGEDDPTLDGDVPTSASSSTTATAEPTTTTTVPAWPTVERAEDVDGLVEQTADVDGDERPDVVQSFPDGDHVTLLVDLAAGGGATVPIATSDAAAVALLGSAVLDEEEGRDVLWVRVGAGAATTVVGLYHLEGCTLAAATFENGDPVELPIGGTVGTASGAKCGSSIDPEADLLVYEATHISGQDYEIVTTEYRWQDGELVRSPESAPTVTRSDDLTDASRFACGDVSL